MSGGSLVLTDYFVNAADETVLAFEFKKFFIKIKWIG
jgi:hypothetical protein